VTIDEVLDFNLILFYDVWVMLTFIIRIIIDILLIQELFENKVPQRAVVLKLLKFVNIG
jgi:hypothetical protein